jgi:polyphosphate kinase
VDDPGFVHKLRHEILATYLADNVKARRMHADGTYGRVYPEAGQVAVNAQECFIASRLDGPEGIVDGIVGANELS